MNSDLETAAPENVELELFYGTLNPAVARVYARWGGVERPGVTVRGTLLGPSCEYSSTLPATSQFVDRGPGGPPLAEAIVPEPSFWTPEMPHLYRAELNLQQDGNVIARASRVFGFRPLGAAQNRLRLDGKNWVLRGATLDEEHVGDLSDWHVSGTAVVVKRPSDLLCDAASRLGVLIVAELAEADLAELRRLSGWPAVGVVILPAGCSFEASVVAHNLLLAERICAGRQPSSWTDVVISGSEAGGAWELPSTSLPIIAERMQNVTTVKDGRAACDRLQADLAAAGLLAGYIS